MPMEKLTPVVSLRSEAGLTLIRCLIFASDRLYD